MSQHNKMQLVINGKVRTFSTYKSYPNSCASLTLCREYKFICNQDFKFSF
ncbi:hypothetical protein HanIR_Chr06g0276351 [Helianthus annuus]|nr:hypothetical protein HanIR_Chr06g0276351 [Helianthus annuus]